MKHGCPLKFYGEQVNSKEIQQRIYNWALTKNFSAPYGIIMGEHTSKKGIKYLAVTFGRARTLDASVEIYNRNFLILRTSRNGSEVFKSVAELQQALDLL